MLVARPSPLQFLPQIPQWGVRMRLGLLINLAPRKLGSLEALLVEMSAEIRRRGHSLDLFGHEPVHSEVARALRELGVGYESANALELTWANSIRRLGTYDLLQVHMFQPRTPPALMAFAAWPAKVMVVLHTDPLPPDDEMRDMRQVFSRALDQVSLFRAEGLVAVSEYVRERGIKRFGLPYSRTEVVYNGVDIRRFSPSPRTEGGPVQLLTVAGLDAHKRLNKGVDVLLQALAELRDVNVRAKVAGDGPLLPILRAQAQQLGVGDRIEFLGLRNDVPDLLRQADLVIHPATCQDANPFTNLEAMACAVPVIASRVGGIPEVVEDGKTGILVPAKDAKALAAAIRSLAEDPHRRQAMGEAGRARVERMYTLEQCAGQYVDLTERMAMESWRSRPRKTAVAVTPRPAGKNVVVGSEVPALFDVPPSASPVALRATGKNVVVGTEVPEAVDGPASPSPPEPKIVRPD